MLVNDEDDDEDDDEDEDDDDDDDDEVSNYGRKEVTTRGWQIEELLIN